MLFSAFPPSTARFIRHGLQGTLVLFALLAGRPTNGIVAESDCCRISLSLQRILKERESRPTAISLLIAGDTAAIRSAVENADGVIRYFAGNIASAVISSDKVAELGRASGIKRIEPGTQHLEALNDQMINNSHAQEVHLGFNLPQSYQGENVVMGIIDEGIDFTHPDFRDLFGRTRLDYVWDHTIQNTDTATQPAPYGYGKEFIGAQIDTSTEHVDGRYSHGSHVAGIACGNGLAVNNYRGVAPKADIIAVKLNLDQPDDGFLSNLVDAVKYIFDRADAAGKPAVINASLGTYFGSHDGKDIQAQAIDYLISQKPGRTMVAAAGNAGNVPIHLNYQVNSDTAFTWLQDPGSGIYIQVWGDSGSFEDIRFSIGAERVRPDFEILGRTPFRTAAAQPGILRTDTIRRGNDRIGIVHSGSEFWNGNWSYEFYIFPDSNRTISGTDTSLYLMRLETTGSGSMDAWSFNMVFDNLPPAAIYPSIADYRRPDTQQNIVSSFTCSDKVITVGSFNNRNFYTNANFAITRDTNIVPGDVSNFSSHGPTRDGRIKPDITAAGSWVLSCGTQAELNVLSALVPDVVAAGRKHKRSSGTSMAAPVVAGVAALYLERYPNATWQDVKRAILDCADRDNFMTGPMPDNTWGYGKVNAYRTVKGCNVGIDESPFSANVHFSVWPNPGNGDSFIEYDVTPTGKRASITAIDALGRTLHLFEPEALSGTLHVADLHLNPGCYFFVLESAGIPPLTRRVIVQ
ncbi:MAG: hypothetical protein RL021_175 [Bacteroidota bacterium]